MLSLTVINTDYLISLATVYYRHLRNELMIFAYTYELRRYGTLKYRDDHEKVNCFGNTSNKTL